MFTAKIRLCKKTLHVLLLVFVPTTTLFFSISDSVYAEEKILKVVSSLPRTGSANSMTTSIVNGIRMALEDAGDKIGDFKIVYEDWDDASPERGNWDPNVEATNADRAIKDPAIIGYIGTFNSGAAKISMPKLNQAGLVMISPGNSWPGLTKKGFGEPSEPAVYRPSGNITYFRVFPTDDIQGPAAAKWAKEMQVKRVFVLHDRELYGKGLADLFKKNAQKIGLTVVGYEGIDSKAANYRSLVIKMRSLRPDLIYFGGTPQTNAGQLAKDLTSGGLSKVKLMVPDGCYDNSFISSSGAQALNSRAYITFPGLPPSMLTGRGKLFYDNYLKRFKSDPSAFAVYGYEAAGALFDAIKRANNKDRSGILNAVRNTKDFSGALGTWSFDENGDISLTKLSGNTVENGTFKFLKLLE
jgi:branched-chain amino acid transport system substrate-binding protein